MWRNKGFIALYAFKWHTQTMVHTSFICAEEPPTVQNKLSVQIMSEHQGVWPLIWSQTYQDKQCKTLHHLLSFSGDQRGECAVEHLGPLSIILCFPRVTESPCHLLWSWLFRRSCQKALVLVLKSRHEVIEPLSRAPKEISSTIRANIWGSYSN